MYTSTNFQCCGDVGVWGDVARVDIALLFINKLSYTESTIFISV